MMSKLIQPRSRRSRTAVAQAAIFAACLPLAAALLAGGAAQAAGNEWTRLDVPYGVDRVTVSPADPDRVMVRGGVFLLRSNDGGSTWARVSQGLPPDLFVQDIVADPVNPNRWVVALAHRLWETRDNGASWQILAELPLTGPYAQIRDLDWCGSSIYVATSGGLFRSMNNGASFSRSSNGIAADEPFAVNLGCRPDTPGLVFALFSRSTNFSIQPGTFYRSADGGDSWTTSVSGLTSVLASGTSVRPVAFGPGGRMAALLATNPRRLLVSQDNGLNYAAGTTLPPGVLPNTTGQLAWTSEATPRLIASGTGVNTSLDGVSWTSFNGGLLIDTPNQPTGTDALQVAANGAIWVVNYRTGAFKSSNGTADFVEQPLYSGGARVTELVLHPTQPGQMLAVLMRLGVTSGAATGLSRMLVRSLDGGQSWSQVTSQFPFGSMSNSEIRVDPSAGSDITNATLYASDNPLAFNGPQFFRSNDGGASWVRADTGIVTTQSGNATRVLLLDPSSASPATRGLWLALEGRFTDNCASGTPGVAMAAARLWKSSDGAASWSSADGFPQPTCVPGRTYRGPAPRPVALARAGNGTLYAGTVLEPGYINNNDPVPGIANGVFRSTNGGTVWTHASSGLPNRTPGDGATSHRDVTALAVMPGNDQIIFAAVSSAVATSVPGALYRSNDGGNSWSLVSNALQGEPHDLLIDPANTARMYYQDYSYRRVHVSEDGGATWGSLSAGLYAGSNATLTLDMLAPQPRLLLGGITGLFSLARAADSDLDGVPSAMEAAAPNGGDGNFDTLADSQQANVASLAPLPAPGVPDGLATLQAAETPRGAAGGYLTIAVTPLSGTCTVLEDVARKAATELAADRGAVRSDAIAFGLLDCTRARISIRGPALAPDAGRGDVVRIFGPTNSAVLDSAAWGDPADAQLQADGFSFSVEDATAGDADSTPQRLRFVARLGSDRIFANGFQ